VASRLVRAFLVAITFCYLLIGGWQTACAPNEPANRAPQVKWSDRTVFLFGNLSDTERIFFTANVAASGHPGTVLYDGPKAGPFLKNFLQAFGPEQVIGVGEFAEAQANLEERLGFPVARLKAAESILDDSGLFTNADTVVLCPPGPRSQLLQAACLAGALHAPLVERPTNDAERTRLATRLKSWQTRTVYVLDGVDPHDLRLGPRRIHRLVGADQIAAAVLSHISKKGPIKTLVLANPDDEERGLGSMSSLSAYVALRHHAALLFTNSAGADSASVVETACRRPELSRAENLIFVASLAAIPTERRANPVPGKDRIIEMEPLTPEGSEPFTYATGRLFHEDPGVVMLMLARERLLEQQTRAMQTGDQRQRRALIVSNPGGGLPLLETFSRTTALEFRQCGYETVSLFDDRVNRQEVRRLLPSQDIFLWEGHYRTLVDSYGMPAWTEPLRPSLIFLQSCLALNEAEVEPLLQRGAIGVIGSSTRTYSGTGGAFTLAFFDGLLYQQLSLGASLRQAKNFLLAYTRLKEKRLGEKAKLAGANLRSAWAFTLWGDPEVHLPCPEPAEESTSHVHPQVRGNGIVLSIPQEPQRTVLSARYEADVWPNVRLAGLVYKDLIDDEKKLVPLLFAEVPLRHRSGGGVPHLTSSLPASRWVFCWDRRRSCGYLLALPRAQDKEEIRFHVSWAGQ